jgi:hypothetical protein
MLNKHATKLTIMGYKCSCGFNHSFNLVNLQPTQKHAFECKCGNGYAFFKGKIWHREGNVEHGKQNEPKSTKKT